MGKKMLRRLLSAALAAVLLLSPVSAAEGGDNAENPDTPVTPEAPAESGKLPSGVAWALRSQENADTGEKEVILDFTGSGTIPDFGAYADVPWYAHAEKITSVKFFNGVTSVGAYAFYGCKNLKTIDFPVEGVTSIGSYAFSECTGLEEIMIPESVTSIGASAFEGCTGLSSAVLPEKIKKISAAAFKGCSFLSFITIPEGVTEIGASAFENSGISDIQLPDSLLTIGASAFARCGWMSDIVIPSHVTSIGAKAFYETGFNDMAIPASVKSIGANAFGPNDNRIHYCGNEADGRNVLKAYLDNMTIHFAKYVNAVRPRDCSRPGNTAGYFCSECDQGFYGYRVDEIAHKYSDKPVRAERIPDYPPYPSGGSTLLPCEEGPAYLIYQCAVCGGEKKVFSQAAIAPHEEEITKKGKEPTCTQSGLTDEITCKVCQQVIQEQVPIPQTGHQPEEKEEEPAACETAGVKAGTVCSVCGAILSGRGTIPALGHAEVALPAEAATCTEAGHTAGKECSRCHKTLEGGTEIPALGHTYRITQDHIPSDCDTNGYYAVQECAVCQNRIGGEVIRINKAHHFIEEEKSDTATCGKDGIKTIVITCDHVNEDQDRCDYYKVEERKSPATGNHIPEDVEYLAPTCTENGHEAGTRCSVCGMRISGARPIPALGHKFETSERVITAATCEKDGEKEITSVCTVCGEKEIKKEKIPAAHKPGPNSDPVIDKAPTCGEAGSQHVTSKCTVCGKEFTQTTAIPATGKHTFGEWTVTAEPTETAQGMRERICKVCKFKEVEMIPAIGEPEAVTYTVTFNANGGTLAGEATRTTDADGRLLTLPVPTRSGYDFQGWFTEADGGDRVMSDYVYTRDTTLYAHWQRNGGSGDDPGGDVPDGGEYPIYWDRPSHGTLSVSSTRAKSGSTVTVRIYPDSGYELRSLWIVDRNGRRISTSSSSWNRYTFTMPNSYVDIDVSFARSRGGSSTSAVTSPVTPSNGVQNVPAYPSPAYYGQPSFDVPAGYWAAGEIGWAIQNGYLITTVDGAFLPDSQVDYQQVWSVMTQVLAKSGAGVTENSLRSIQSGLADGRDPAAPASRQEIVTALYRCAYLVKNGKIAGGDLKSFADAGLVAGYAKEAMGWAAANGIINGTADGKLNPAGNITRAQYAVLLYRFCQNI